MTDRNVFAQMLYDDKKINEMIEEVKEEAEEDAHYGVEDYYKLERVATAG